MKVTIIKEDWSNIFIKISRIADVQTTVLKIVLNTVKCAEQWRVQCHFTVCKTSSGRTGVNGKVKLKNIEQAKKFCCLSKNKKQMFILLFGIYLC